MKAQQERRIIELRPNGDPYGRGFVGTEYRHQAEYDTGIGVYRGDIGAASRASWRAYCRRHGFILRFMK